MYWEFQLIKFLQDNGSAFLDVLWSFISIFGEELIMVGVVGLLYWCLNKDFAKYLAYSVMSSIVFNGLLKNIVVRNRPFQKEDWGIENKKSSTADGYSFPSGHSQGSSSLFVSLAIWIKKKWMTALAIIIPILVAFSRLYLGAHFPTDVLAGLAIGTGLSFLFYFLYKKVQDKTLLYLVTMLIGSIGLFYCNTDDYFKIYGLMVGAFAAFIFESKYINFECDGVIWWKKLLRLLFGLLIVLAFKEGLKPLFDLIAKESFYLAMIRYMITGFVGLGLYPWLFKKLKFLS